MNATISHFWKKLLFPVFAIIVVGAIAYTVSAGWKNESNSIAPAEGKEGSDVTITVPKGTHFPTPVTAVFTDSGEHGFVSKQNGGGIYMTYDESKGLTYKSTTATTASDQNGNQTFLFTVPDGICGYIIKSDLEPNPPPKYVTVTLTGPDGEPLLGAPTATYGVKCDTYTLSVKINTSKDPVLPDGVDLATVSANLSVTGPAQFINGKKIPPGSSKIMLTTPLGNVDVEFTTDLGSLNPAAPAKVRTDLAGNASVTVSSSDAGIASVRATALAIGDAKQQIHFKPNIAAVKEDFIPPNSPTNYELQTIPKNAKDLNFTWTLNYPGGGCGSLTGGLAGKNLLKNAFYHGPQGNFTDGCPEAQEMTSTITVTVTDKDGQSDTKTFTARGFEGQGFKPVQ